MKLGAKIHPDKLPGCPDATKAFQALIRAYEKCVKPELREDESDESGDEPPESEEPPEHDEEPESNKSRATPKAAPKKKKRTTVNKPARKKAQQPGKRRPRKQGRGARKQGESSPAEFLLKSVIVWQVMRVMMTGWGLVLRARVPRLTIQITRILKTQSQRCVDSGWWVFTLCLPQKPAQKRKPGARPKQRAKCKPCFSDTHEFTLQLGNYRCLRRVNNSVAQGPSLSHKTAQSATLWLPVGIAVT